MSVVGAGYRLSWRKSQIKTETVFISFLCATEKECLNYLLAWWKDKKLFACWWKGGAPEHGYCLNVGTFWMTVHNERKQGLSVISHDCRLLQAGFVVVWGKPFLNIIIWFMPGPSISMVVLKCFMSVGQESQKTISLDPLVYLVHLLASVFRSSLCFILRKRIKLQVTMEPLLLTTTRHIYTWSSNRCFRQQRLVLTTSKAIWKHRV